MKTRELAAELMPDRTIRRIRDLSGDEQQFAALGQGADLVGGEHRPADVLLAVGDSGCLGIEGPAHGLEDDGFLAEQVGDQASAVVVVDAEHLQDAGVRQEGAGPGAIAGAQLVHVLEDGPELDAIARHQAHGALDGREVAQGREFVEKIEHRPGRGTGLSTVSLCRQSKGLNARDPGGRGRP